MDVLYALSRVCLALQPVVRKQHNTGYKHKANVRNYYMQFEEAQTQDLIDNKILEFKSRSREAFQAQVLPGLLP